MPEFTMTVRHRLSRDEATTRIKNLLQDMKAQYANDIDDVREEWGPYALRFSLKARGHDISGVITVGWFQVKLEGGDPPSGRAFAKKNREDHSGTSPTAAELGGWQERSTPQTEPVDQTTIDRRKV
jgi:hypothetical protein